MHTLGHCRRFGQAVESRRKLGSRSNIGCSGDLHWVPRRNGGGSAAGLEEVSGSMLRKLIPMAFWRRRGGGHSRGLATDFSRGWAVAANVVGRWCNVWRVSCKSAQF
jgi:hypothetical protein